MSVLKSTHMQSIFCNHIEIHIEGAFCRLSFGEMTKRAGQADEVVWHHSVTVAKDFALQIAQDIREVYQRASPLTIVKN